MTPKGKTPENSPTWDDVRDEASALTREVMKQSLIWSRRAFQVANTAAWAATKALEEAGEKTSETVKKVIKR